MSVETKKCSWKVVAAAKCSKDNRKVLIKLDNRSLVLDIADLFEMIAGHRDFVNAVEPVESEVKK